MKKWLKYVIPWRVKKALKVAYYSVLDLKNRLMGKAQKNVPPKKMNFVGSANFEQVGQEFLGHFVELGGLKQSDAVLDIGCGVGRMALPLTGYLVGGNYTGFDIVKMGVEWCQKHIADKHRNFRFLHMDVYNQFYNEHGKISPLKCEFPKNSFRHDGTYDFSFATSVFTHMLPEEIEHYFEQVSGVLTKGARVLFTFFVLPNGVKDEGGKGSDDGFYRTPFIHFQFLMEKVAYYSHKGCPEAEVGYREEWVRKLFEKNGFTNVKIYPGKWHGGSDGVSYQDMVVAEKA